MMRVETKVTIQATAPDIAPLQNFLGWLEDMDPEVFEACNDILPMGYDLDTIAQNLEDLLDQIEIY